MGLIPAHAGKTRGEAIALEGTEAHPRSRGENVAPSAGVVRVEGSSPLTRGKLFPVIRQTGGAGLIPAHAGKTLEVEGQQGTAWAHPRSRGENRGW